MNDWDDAALDTNELVNGVLDDYTQDEFEEAYVDEDDEEAADADAAVADAAIADAAVTVVAVEAVQAPIQRAEAVIAGAVATPIFPPTPPRPIPVRDKTVTYLSLPGFDEFADFAPVYGELLRMRYAETRLPPDLQELVVRFPETLYIVAVATEGDPDTAAVLPIVARLVDASVRLNLRIVEDEDEEDLRPLALLLPDLDMAAALDEWDLPQLLLFDEEWELQAQWGPRPAAADERVEAWLAGNPDYEALAGDESPAGVAAHAELNHALLYEMRVWYNSGLARACLDEWRDLLTGLLAPDELDASGER